MEENTETEDESSRHSAQYTPRKFVADPRPKKNFSKRLTIEDQIKASHRGSHMKEAKNLSTLNLGMAKKSREANHTKLVPETGLEQEQSMGLDDQ